MGQTWRNFINLVSAALAVTRPRAGNGRTFVAHSAGVAIQQAIDRIKGFSDQSLIWRRRLAFRNRRGSAASNG
jgi:hypothetical protein